MARRFLLSLLVLVAVVFSVRLVMAAGGAGGGGGSGGIDSGGLIYKGPPTAMFNSSGVLTAVYAKNDPQDTFLLRLITKPGDPQIYYRDPDRGVVPVFQNEVYVLDERTQQYLLQTKDYDRYVQRIFSNIPFSVGLSAIAPRSGVTWNYIEANQLDGSRCDGGNGSGLPLSYYEKYKADPRKPRLDLLTIHRNEPDVLACIDENEARLAAKMQPIEEIKKGVGGVVAKKEPAEAIVSESKYIISPTIAKITNKLVLPVLDIFNSKKAPTRIRPDGNNTNWAVTANAKGGTYAAHVNPKLVGSAAANFHLFFNKENLDHGLAVMTYKKKTIGVEFGVEQLPLLAGKGGVAGAVARGNDALAQAALSVKETLDRADAQQDKGLKIISERGRLRYVEMNIPSVNLMYVVGDNGELIQRQCFSKIISPQTLSC